MVQDFQRRPRNNSSSGRPFMLKINESVVKVCPVLVRDRRLRLKMIAYEVSMSKDTVHRIVTKKLRMRKNCAKLVPKNLSDEQKENRFSISQ
ncbi:hypothetical protein Trydic_g13609 [Trypoxylus dichotomus]